MAVSEEESSSAKSRSASNGVHYLAKCVLRGSVVLQVVQGHIRSPSSNDVVFGKETSIELVIVDDDGITQSICEQPVFGTIKDLAILPWNEKFHARSPQMMGKDLLVVISDSGMLSFLTFSNEMHRFFPLQHIPLSAPGNSRYQVGRMLAVDPYGCFIAASAYEDRLSMFSVSMSAGSDIIDKRIFYPSDNEGDTSTSRGPTSICGTIWSMCFISNNFHHPSKEHSPVLAILLNRMGSFLNELLLLEWNTREQAVHVISQYAEAGPLAHDVVEVPHSYGFAILFRVGDALLMDLRDVHNPCCVYRITLPASVEEHDFVEADEIFNVAASALLELGDVRKDDDPMSIDGESGNGKSNSSYVCSWSWEPGNGKNPRMIICVDSGEFFMIKVSSDSDGPSVDMSECLYKGLPCKALLWVEGGLLAALVEMGDGMVLKLEDGRLLCRSPIQNIAPILDMSVMDYHDEKHDPVFACCGKAPEGSLRIIRSGISVEKLLRTAPIYQGMTGTWTLKMKLTDSHHSFLVLSFVEQTRVLSVGLSFTDVTDMVGFQPDVCTLACGLVGDGLLAQIHQNAVRLCLPTAAAQADGIPSSSPICTSWSPDNITISLGAVGHNLIVVSTSSPSFLFILGVRYLSACHYEVYEMQHVSLQNELSCMSIPQKHFKQKLLTSCSNMGDKSLVDTLPDGVDIGSTFVIGTHKPSVEVLSFLPNKGLRVVALGAISLTNTMRTAISGCVPQDVRLVLVDRLYVLSGLRNGMLLRFEWPTASTMSSFVSSSQRPCSSSCLLTPDAFLLKAIGPHIHALGLSEKAKDNPVHLQLIAIRRIGITPAFLIPLSDALDADVIALSDRPWLLHTARHSLSYTSISFQPSSHVTPVCSVECPKGILFVAENCLHLVEMVHTKRLNVQKFHLGGTPRKVLYHSESRLLLVMRTELSHDSYSSDICCVDPLSGSVLSSFRLDPGETGKTMDLVRVGNEQVLVVGTSQSSDPVIMPSGEAERRRKENPSLSLSQEEGKKTLDRRRRNQRRRRRRRRKPLSSTKGRLIVLCLENMHNSDSGSMTFYSKAGSSSQQTSPFHEIVGYAAEQLSSSSLCSSPDDNSCDGIKLEETESWHLRVRRFAVGRTRFMIMTLTTHFTRIAVGDCRDGILFYTYHEDARRLDQIYCDPFQRLVADCILMDIDTAVVSDRKGSITVLSCSNQLEDGASPECNLTRSCSFYMGEIAMSIRKGSFSCKLPADDIMKGCDVANTIIGNSIMASTLLGSIVVFIPISREEYELLEVLQSRLVVHPLTAPILGNDHNEFRSRQCSAGVPKILDGDMLAQFLELTSMQQEAVVALPLGSPDTVMFSSKSSSPAPITVNQVVRLLERVHYALN
ncbi:uncharacterized protein LOC130772478 isoform X5 [Actinidia eriantha]|uniref:uncharacterized protein LOC130772478 isoform X5 n=1 Tax=Actinidia eriantha TaxID=165200 RepID=UPI002585D323|nr:uncharacterized protein LOC130772478 isoform X5 [Actinidia eriantha]